MTPSVSCLMNNVHWSIITKLLFSKCEQYKCCMIWGWEPHLSLRKNDLWFITWLLFAVSYFPFVFHVTILHHIVHHMFHSNNTGTTMHHRQWASVQHANGDHIWEWMYYCTRAKMWNSIHDAIRGAMHNSKWKCKL